MKLRPWRSTLLAFVLFANHSMFSEILQWNSLAPLPDPQGFAGPFAGVSGGALLVAGGANITGDKWTEPIHKKWYDSIFVLERPESAWKSGFHLPRPCAYGVSVTTPKGLVCLGGGDEIGHSSEAFLLRWEGGEVHQSLLPRLPRACAYACGALLGNTIYVAGGSEAPTSTTALHTFWSLDLRDKHASWRELEPWPGSARILAVAGVANGSFFLFSGASLKPDEQGKPVRTYLSDAYAYAPGRGWRRLADLPRPAVAAPSPALSLESSKLCLVSGDDGKNTTFQPIQEHPGFPHNLLVYDTDANTWETLPNGSFSRVTAPVVLWHGSFIIPNGEVRPRVRTPEIVQALPSLP